MALYLTDAQIAAGAESLTDNKLTADQIDDLISIFRKYLKHLATNYALRTTFEALTDTATSKRAAKLAACLLLWQDVQFDNSAFAATNANRTGYTDSTIAERYDIFEYAFGLFWDLPANLPGASGSSSLMSGSSDGFFQRF